MTELLGVITSFARENAGPAALRILLALAVAVITIITAKIVARWATRLVRRSKAAASARGATLSPIVGGVVFGLVTVIGFAMALDQVGVKLGALLAGAGVVGLAVGFGAQALVKDCLAGFFLILDDVFNEGDVVMVDDVQGTIERVGLRTTQLRTYEGQLWTIPNGEIKRVGSWSRTWVRAIVQVGLAYEQDVDKGIAVLKKVGEAWANEKEYEDIILEPPVVEGVLGLNGSDITVRLVVKIDNRSKSLWPIERDLRRRVKAAFDAAGVEIPFERRVIYHRNEDSDSDSDSKSLGADSSISTKAVRHG